MIWDGHGGVGIFHGSWFGNWVIGRKSSGTDSRKGRSAKAGGGAGEGPSTVCVRGEEGCCWTPKERSHRWMVSSILSSYEERERCNALEELVLLRISL